MSSIAPISTGHPSLACLPAEIRCDMYYALVEPRVVELCYDEDIKTLWTTAKVPVVLQICRESRQEAQRHYELSFAGMRSGPNIWFNFTLDTLLFGHHSLAMPTIESAASAASLFEAAEGLEVKNLAIHSGLMEVLSRQLADDVAFYENEGESLWNARLLVIPEFHNLEHLTIVGPIESFDPDMYEEICERAKDEEFFWAMPEIGYIIEEIDDSDSSVMSE